MTSKKVIKMIKYDKEIELLESKLNDENILWSTKVKFQKRIEKIQVYQWNLSDKFNDNEKVDYECNTGIGWCDMFGN